MSRLLLSLKDFSVKNLAGAVLAKIEFSLSAGEVFCIEGPNGSGKSSLLKGLWDLSQSPRGYSTMGASCSLRLQFMPQALDQEFFVPMTLGDFIDLAPEPTVPWRETFEDIVPPDLARKFWNTASGGERQRALLVATLIQAADVYLLDEPFNHLDSGAIELISSRILFQARKKEGPAFLIATHRRPSALQGARALTLSAVAAE